jgi:hypothetical protein
MLRQIPNGAPIYTYSSFRFLHDLNPGAALEKDALGYLPLHLFLYGIRNSISTTSSTSASVWRDTLRFLLKVCPDAAKSEMRRYYSENASVDSDYLVSDSYRYVAQNLYQTDVPRLLLLALPTLMPSELHKLNYKARRVALLLLFGPCKKPITGKKTASASAFAYQHPICKKGGRISKEALAVGEETVADASNVSIIDLLRGGKGCVEVSRLIVKML